VVRLEIAAILNLRAFPRDQDELEHRRRGGAAMKIVIAVAALIIAVMIAAACFSFNPAIPVFLILGYGIYRVGRDGEALPPGDINSHWGSGHGIYFDKDDVWVQGGGPDERRTYNDDRSPPR
jgi:hypothetical protein